MATISPSKDPGVFEVFTLKNGIKVFYRHAEQTFGLPKIACSVLVMVGGRDDPLGKEGCAHFFEHMPFRGTKLYPSLFDLTNEIENNGGYINAFTTDEATGYEIIVPSAMIDEGVSRLADMLTQPLMRAEDIEIERKVILEELRNKLANVGFYGRQQLFQGLLGDHPLVHAVIGDESALMRVKKSHLEDFHSRYYNNSNIQLFFAGSFDTTTLRDYCERYFGGLASGETTNRHVQPLSKSQNNYLVELQPKRYNRSLYLLGRTLPPTNYEQTVMLKLFRDMLSRGMNSPLSQEIREKRGLAYNLSVQHSRYQDVGVLAFGVFTQFSQMDEVDAIIWQQIELILQNQSRFDEVRHAVGQSILYSEYAVGSLVDTAIDSHLDFGRIIPVAEAIEILDRITLAQTADYVSSFLDKNQFLNIRVNCDKANNN